MWSRSEGTMETETVQTIITNKCHDAVSNGQNVFDAVAAWLGIANVNLNTFLLLVIIVHLFIIHWRIRR